MTRAPILDALTFKWNEDNNAASHSDPEKFRARMKARQQAVQTKPVATVTIIKPTKKDASK